MAIAKAMAALKKELEKHTDRPVMVGAPLDDRPGVYLHPYSVEETMELRNHAGDDPGMRVRMFLSVRPEDDYDLLETAIRCLREKAVVLADGMSVGISRSASEPADIAPIFQAMDIPYRMTVPYEIRITAPSNDD